MSESVRSALGKLYASFLENLEPKDLLPHMRLQDALPEADIEKIRIQESRKDRVMQFTEICKRKLVSLEHLETALKAEGYEYKDLFPKIENQLSSLHFSPVDDSWRPAKSLKDSLHPFFEKHFGKIRPLPQCNTLFDINELWVNLQLRDWVSPLAPKVTKDYTALLGAYLTPDSLPVVVTGEAGVGKSTLIKKLCHDWASQSLSPLQKFDLVLPARLREVAPNHSRIIDIALAWLKMKLPYQNWDAILQCFESSAIFQKQKILVLLDGLDESDCNCQELQDLLHTKDLHLPYQVLITTRPRRIQRVPMDCTMISVEGFDVEQQEKYIDLFFSKVNQEKESIIIKQKLNDSPHIAAIAQNPSLLTFLCIASDALDSKRVTDVYVKLCEWIIQMCNLDKDRKLLISTNWKNDESVLELGRLALDGLMNENETKLQFTEEELQAKYEFDKMSVCVAVGFLSKQGYREDDQDKFFTTLSFYHKTIQEFFAALYITTCLFHQEEDTISDLENFLERRIDNAERLEQVCIFCIGLCNTEAEANILQKFLQSTSWFHCRGREYSAEEPCVSMRCPRYLFRELQECVFESNLKQGIHNLLLSHVIFEDSIKDCKYFFRQATRVSENISYNGKTIVFLETLSSTGNSAGTLELVSSPSAIKNVVYHGTVSSLHLFINYLKKSKIPKIEYFRVDVVDSMKNSIMQSHNTGYPVESLELKAQENIVSGLSCAMILNFFTPKELIVDSVCWGFEFEEFDKLLVALPDLPDHLQFLYASLGDANIQLLADILGTKQVEKCSVTYCDINSIQAMALVKAVQQNLYITGLSLDGNEEIRRQDFNGFCQEIKRCSHLRKVELPDLGIHSDDEVHWLIQALQSLPKLEKLQLVGNRISIEQEKHIRRATSAEVVL